MTIRAGGRSLRRVVAVMLVLASLAAGCTDNGSARTPKRPDPIAAAMSAMTMEQKVGQLFVVGVSGASAQDSSIQNAKNYGSDLDTPAKIVARYNLGGVIYFRDSGNLVTPRQTAELSNGLQRAATTSGAKLPLLISVDQESGSIDRVRAPATVLPGAMGLGSTYVSASRGNKTADATADARQAAEITSRELRAMGINVDHAPIADVNVNPDNPVIGSRSFSSDPDVVSTLVAAQVAGFEGSGSADQLVSATAKHFPGHGDTNVDSHTGIPVINSSRQEWERIAAPPFKAAIKAGVDSIMTAHIVMPKLDPSGDPATLSKPILTGLLRQELGFDGVVFTDSLSMKGVRDKYGDARVPVLALNAGADVLLTPPDFRAAYDGVLSAIRSGELSQQHVDQSVRRILRLKINRGVLKHPVTDVASVDRVVGTKDHLAAAQRISDDSITLLRNDGAILPRKPGGKVLVTGWGSTRYPSQKHTTALLADRIAARGVSARAVATGAQPSAEQVKQVAAAERDSDLVVVLTNRGASTDDGAAQHALVTELAKTGVPVVGVAVGEPYDAAQLPGCGAWLASYGSSEPTLESITKVLFGELKPTGKLPVSIPAPDGKGVAYPFGHGLSD